MTSLKEAGPGLHGLRALLSLSNNIHRQGWCLGPWKASAWGTGLSSAPWTTGVPPAQPSPTQQLWVRLCLLSFLPFSVSYRVSLVPWDPREDPAPLATL